MKFKKSPLGEIPIHWDTITLKECTIKITDGTHSTVKDNVEGQYYLLSCKNIKNGNVVLGENERRIDYETLIKLRTRTGLRKDDILLTTVGTIGETAIIEKEEINYEFQRSVAIIRCNSEIILPKFLYYLTKSTNFQSQANGRVSGSVQKCLFLGAISEIVIPLPPINEQRKIIEILDAIDNKRTANNEMNKTLEEMAQALFKRWFVDFEFPNEDGEPYKSSGGEMVASELGMIPKSWDVKMLKDISIITMGVSPSSSSYNKEKIGLPLLNGAADFQGKLIKPSKYTTEPKKICGSGDMVFGVRATIGNTVFTDEEYALGRGVAAVKPNNDCYRELIYFILNNSMEKLINSASGSVFLNLKKADITDLKVCFNNDIVNIFHKVVSNLINKVIENDKESEMLKQSRDSLLPKFMSGDIRVEDIEANL